MMHSGLRILPLVFSALLAGMTAPAIAGGAGVLTIYANGEELAAKGFTGPTLTRDGWALKFEHLYINMSGVTAFQAEPPYDAHQGGDIPAVVAVVLDSKIMVDLANPAEDGRVKLGEISASAGHFNALSFSVEPGSEGLAAGYGVVLIGMAEKDDKKVAFTLRSDEKADYRCGEYVGDERKGVVVAGGSADLEATFHLDHIFGRADLPPDDKMNAAAIGFDPFASGGDHKLTLKGQHIGHVGEGHCNVEWR